MFSAFRDRFPAIYLDIRLQSSGAQVDALARGEIDAGFEISPLPRAGLFLDTLFRPRFALQAPQSLCEAGPRNAI
jgi:DNA-binding transcriptional LysR family regulator